MAKFVELQRNDADEVLLFIPCLNGKFDGVLELIKRTGFNGYIIGLDWKREFNFSPNIDLSNPLTVAESLQNYVLDYINVCKEADVTNKVLNIDNVLAKYKKVYVVAHSMGTRSAFSILSNYSIQSNNIIQVVLLNGAAPVSTITFPFEKFCNSIGTKIVNVYNTNDPVLQLLGRYLRSAESIPLLGEIFKTTAFFRPIGLEAAHTIFNNVDFSRIQGFSHSFEASFSQFQFLNKIFITNQRPEGSMYSSIFDDQQTSNSSTKDVEDRNEIVKELDLQANSIIMKYSMLAGVSGILPIPEALTDSVIQLQMLNELRTTYKFDSTLSSQVMSMFASIVDNLSSKQVIKTLTQFLHAIPVIGQFLAPAASYILDFGYTYIIGYVFKSVFRTAYLKNLNKLEIKDIGSLISEAISSVYSFIKENWKMLLMGRKRVIERYELDLDALNSEFASTINKYSDLFKQSANNLHAMKAEIGNLSDQSDDIETLIIQLAKEMRQPSMVLLIGEARLKLIGGENIDPILQTMIDIEDSQRFANKLLKEHN